MSVKVSVALAMLLATVPALAQPVAATSSETTFPTLVEKIDLAANDTLVFLGDSITHQCLYTQYVEDYFVTRYPHTKVHFHNAGVGGDRCTDALIRFKDDVAKYKPKFVTVLLGMNDGSYQAFNQDVFNTYEAGVAKVIEEIQAIGATPVLMGPTMFDARAARMRPQPGDPNRNRYYNSTLAYYSALLREEATSKGLGFVDMYTPLNEITLEQRKKDANFTLIGDAVHPGPSGQAVMAVALLEQMHGNRRVSAVTVNVVGDKKVNARAGGAKVSDSSYENGVLHFTVLADSIPWVLPEEAAQGYELTKAGHRLSNEKLIVTGLPAGKYTLSIDDQTIGTYQHTALARGIELQSNPATPQYQQAAAVAAMNKERNDKVIRPLRNLWGSRKGLRRAEAQAQANPNDAEAAKKLETAKAQLADADQKIAEFDRQNEEMLAKMYETAQPQPRRYVLQPVGN